jgi:hypothetical protein
LIEQKIKEFGAFSEKLGFGWVGDKMGIFGNLGGRRWVGTVENGRRWCSGGGGGGYGWWVIFGVRVEKDEGGGSRLYGWWGKWGKEGEKVT